MSFVSESQTITFTLCTKYDSNDNLIYACSDTARPAKTTLTGESFEID